MPSKDQDAAAPPRGSCPGQMTSNAEGGWAFDIPSGYKPYSDWLKERTKPAAVPAPANATGLRYGRQRSAAEDLALLRSLRNKDAGGGSKSK